MEGRAFDAFPRRETRLRGSCGREACREAAAFRDLRDENPLGGFSSADKPFRDLRDENPLGGFSSADRHSPAAGIRSADSCFARQR